MINEEDMCIFCDNLYICDNMWDECGEEEFEKCKRKVEEFNKEELIMKSILMILGEDLGSIPLYDDNSIGTGGLSRSDEVLYDFMEDCELSPSDSIGELQKALSECGLKQLEFADKVVEEQIQQRIHDIEEEFGVELDYNWDYKEFKR